MRLIKKTIETEIEDSEHIQYVRNFSDLALDFKTTYTPFELIMTERDHNFKIMAIVGQSGSGKSTLLKSLSKPMTKPQWSNRPIVEHIHPDPEYATKCLTSVGLSSVPCWLKPYSVLSTGEKYRANLAYGLAHHDHLYFDEFASVVDEDTAISSSNAIFKAIHRQNKQMIVATCRRDILPYLKPCIVVDLDKEFVFATRGWERQEFQLQLHRIDRSYWRWFAQYHYLTGHLPDGCHNYLVTATFPTGENKVVGFIGILRFAHPIKNGWLSSRVVVLPQFQGMGFGTKIEELMGNYLVGTGYRLFCKTSHPFLGIYRNKNPQKWRATKRNGKSSPDYLTRGLENTYTKRNGKEKKEVSQEKILWAASRISYSHEWIGGTTYEDKRPTQLSLF
jgi:energy-coupling factor transporter ATP-binding protein EcfA2